MCNECVVAKEIPLYTLFCPSCIYCGARLIQRISSLNISDSEMNTRKDKVRFDWVAYGHSDSALTRLINGPSAICPAKVVVAVKKKGK